MDLTILVSNQTNFGDIVLFYDFQIPELYIGENRLRFQCSLLVLDLILETLNFKVRSTSTSRKLNNFLADRLFEFDE